MALQNIDANILLDLYNHDTTPTTVKAIQLDSQTRYVAALLQNGGAQYDIDSGATVQLIVVRPDNVGVQITGTTFEYGEEGAQYLGAYAELTQVALAVSGKMRGQFKITSGDQILRTEIFTISNGEALDASTDEWADEYDGYNLEEMATSIETNTADIATLEADVSQIKEDFTDLEAFVNLSSGKCKNIPMSRSGSANGLTVVYKYGKVTLNGECASNNVVLEADSDITAVKEGIPYRQGINSGLISDNASARKIPIEAGRYRVVFNMLSGSVTKGGVTYTDNDDFGTANVVNAFLLKPDATTGSYTLSKTNVTTEVDLSVTQLGLQVLYCYSGCSFTNAVFELYLEKVG